MIIPFLDGFMTFSRVPITWLLILINAFLFSQNYSLSTACQEEFDYWYKDNNFLYTQGQIYKQYNNERSVAAINDYETLGRLAFRDEDFLKFATRKSWLGDQIAINKWREQLDEFMILRSYYPPMILGVSDSQKDFVSTISYQFYHEGFLHLLGNLLLLLIIGGYLERRYSGLLVFGTYLVGGSLAAYLFTMTPGMSGAPLIGASGSLCALLGLLLVFEFKKETRLFYFFLPSSKYIGFVFVPTVYWILLLCMAEDVSGWLAQPDLFSSGVAHAVHMLGFIIGIAIGLLIKYSGLEFNQSATANQYS